MVPKYGIPDAALIMKSRQAPGLCSIDEIEEIHEWLKFFYEHLAAYRAVYGEPVGYSVNSAIDKMEWYIKFHQENPDWASGAKDLLS